MIERSLVTWPNQGRSRLCGTVRKWDCTFDAFEPRITLGQDTMGTPSSKLEQSPRPKPANFGRSLLGIAFVIVVSAVLRVWLIGHTDVIARDGIIYMEMAQEFANGPSKVIKGYDHHVG